MYLLKEKRGQSTLEYIIVFTVIVAGVLLAASGAIKGKTQNMLEHAINEADDAVKCITFP